MRMLALLFAFYISALTAIPCTDKEDCKYQDSQTNSYLSKTDHTNHDRDEEHCPPFCVCACCGQTLSIGLSTCIASSNMNDFQKFFPAYESPFVKEVFFNIWQPPKVS